MKAKQVTPPHSQTLHKKKMNGIIAHKDEAEKGKD